MAKLDIVTCLIMVVVQLGYAGMNIFATLAMDSGMNPYVHSAYRQLFATAAIVPLACFMERNIRPKMTKAIFIQLFFSSLFGATLNQLLYLIGLKFSTPTEAVAFSNLSSAFTFILAALFRLEKVGIQQWYGQAKVLGTVISIGGAMLMSFYNGPQIMTNSPVYLGFVDNLRKSSSSTHASVMIGPLLLIGSTFSGAVWYIIQARLGEKYPVPYSTSAWICAMASVECAIIAVVVDHRAAAWSLAFPIRAISSVYAGIVCSAIAFYGMVWCIQKKGPLYVSVFSPFQLVVVAVLGWIILDEKLHVGTVLGSSLIVLGLLTVLWGKKKEPKTAVAEDVV